MARVCQVTGKRPVTGNNVSHAKNRTRRRFLPNLHQHRFWVESEKRFVSLRVSSKGMRIIDKKGIETVLADMRARVDHVTPQAAIAPKTASRRTRAAPDWTIRFARTWKRSRMPRTPRRRATSRAPQRCCNRPAICSPPARAGPGARR